MKVRLTHNLGRDLRDQIGGDCKAGDVVDVIDAIGKTLVARRLGHAVDDPAPRQEIKAVPPPGDVTAPEPAAAIRTTTTPKRGK